MDYILQFCAENNLFCIEDCAHAFDSNYNGRRLGTFGQAAVFSLSKCFPCCVGGAIYSRLPEIHDFVEKISLGHNARLARSAFKHRMLFDADSSMPNQIKLASTYAIY